MGKEKLVTRTLTLPTGERKYIRAKTAAEADQRLFEMKRLLGMGISVNDKSTFEYVARGWTVEPHRLDSTVAGIGQLRR